MTAHEVRLALASVPDDAVVQVVFHAQYDDEEDICSNVGSVSYDAEENVVTIEEELI